jgi:hypothetical protein
VAQFLLNNSIHEQFHLPLSVQAFQEYQDLQQLIQGIQIQSENNNKWTYIWGNDRYSASKFYHLPFKNATSKAIHGYGIQSAQTSLEFLHGSYSWIDSM